MICKETLAVLREFEKLGTLKSHIIDLRYQIDSERIAYGAGQTTTKEELRCAEAMLEGTFNEEENRI